MIPTPIPRIPILIPRIPIIPPIPFPNSPFWPFYVSLFPLHFPKLKFIVDLKFNLVL